MKKLLILLLATATLSLCACGGTPEAAETPPTPVPTEAPTAEPTATPEPPGTGRIRIHVAHVSGEAFPTVTVTGRDGAAEAINALLKQETHALYHIPRGDGALLSLVWADTSAEDSGLRRWGGLSFNTRTGEALTFADLALDEEALKTLCKEFLAEAGMETAAERCFADGWYLSGEGLAFLPEGSAYLHPVTVPYGALLGLLKDEYSPPERLPVQGALSGAYTVDAPADVVQLDEVTVSGGMESVLIWAQGDVQDVRAVLVETSDGAAFTETALLWYASSLEDGEAVRLNVTVPEGIPNLKLCWQTDQGLYEALLTWNGQTGGAQLTSLTGQTAAADSPYAHITHEALLGHWYNDATGADGQAFSIAGSNVCYLWHNGLGYEGDGFLWELQRRDGEGLSPQIILHASNGDLIYTVEELTENRMTTDKGVFTRAEAVG